MMHLSIIQFTVIDSTAPTSRGVECPKEQHRGCRALLVSTIVSILKPNTKIDENAGIAVQSLECSGRDRWGFDARIPGASRGSYGIRFVARFVSSGDRFEHDRSCHGSNQRLGEEKRGSHAYRCVIDLIGVAWDIPS